MKSKEKNKNLSFFYSCRLECMKIAFKILLTFSLITSSLNLYTAECPQVIGKYGNGIQYQNLFCRIMVNADRINSKSYRNVIFTDEGQIQVFSNFPGTTNSNSTGARVYYLFPFKTKKSIIEANNNHLAMRHPSGAIFDFDKTGRISSPDLEIKHSAEINSNNKSGVEIKNFPNGLLVDLGYRMGASPINNKNAVVTITDKNNLKCKMLNNDLNKIDNDEVELIYKTNEDLYDFLAKKCPKLDISDLLAPMNQEINAVMKSRGVGSPPRNTANEKSNNSKRDVIKKEGQDSKTDRINKGSVQR